MAFETFDTTKFRPAGLKMLKHATAVLAEYKAQNFVLTLRQLYYQMFARGFIPENTFRAYKNLGTLIDSGRRRGLIDWAAIEDRDRNLAPPNAWTDAEHLMQNTPHWYKENPWLEQRYRPEVWVEKVSLISVVERGAYELRAPYLACKGYLSQSEAYSAGKRLARMRQQGYEPVIFHLGDHDPSGIDMTRDNTERVSEYAGYQIELVRLGLNMDQVERYSLTPNYAKDTDSRFSDYLDTYGDESWELDALEPQVIMDLIKDALQARIDQSKWDASMEQEEFERNKLRAVAEYWDDALDAAELARSEAEE